MYRICVYFSLLEYSSQQAVIPANNASFYQSNIHYNQSAIANSSQFSGNSFEAACSLLNSNSLLTNPQVDISNNHPASSVPLEYSMCDYDSSLAKISDFNNVSHNGCSNFAMSNSYCDKYQTNCNSLQMDYSSSSVHNSNASIQTCPYDSSIHELGHASQLSSSIQPMYDPADTNLCTPSLVYHTGQNQYCYHNSFEADRGVSANCYVEANDQMDLPAVSVSLQPSESGSFNDDLHVFNNLEAVSVDDSFNLEHSCQSEGDTLGVDIGIQCELGPETLQALIIDDDVEVAGLKELEPSQDSPTTENLEVSSSSELKGLLLHDYQLFLSLNVSIFP